MSSLSGTRNFELQRLKEMVLHLSAPQSYLIVRKGTPLRAILEEQEILCLTSINPYYSQVD
ncbi:hypothetical protein GCM10026983_33910 [Gracilibacillus alcaliphilus]